MYLKRSLPPLVHPPPGSPSIHTDQNRRIRLYSKTVVLPPHRDKSQRFVLKGPVVGELSDRQRHPSTPPPAISQDRYKIGSARPAGLLPLDLPLTLCLCLCAPILYNSGPRAGVLKAPSVAMLSEACRARLRCRLHPSPSSAPPSDPPAAAAAAGPPPPSAPPLAAAAPPDRARRRCGELQLR